MSARHGTSLVLAPHSSCQVSYSNILVLAPRSSCQTSSVNTITVVNEYSEYGLFIPRVLEQLSLWTMPQLRHFHFVCHKLTEDLKTSLFAFTEEHGHLLQALVVRPVYRSDYNYGPFLSDILRLCPNLGHVAIPYRLSNNPE